MLPVRPTRRSTLTVALPAVCLLFAVSCSSTKHLATTATTTTTSASTSSTAGSSTTGSTSASTSTTASGTAHVPASCTAIPKALISTYIGSVGMTQSLKAAAGSVSCEFANGNASKIVIVNIGKGGPSAFATLRSISGAGGRTVTAINGLGTSAFSITRNGVPGGLVVLTPQGVLYSISANLPVAQDEALIQQLEKL